MRIGSLSHDGATWPWEITVDLKRDEDDYCDAVCAQTDQGQEPDIDDDDGDRFVVVVPKSLNFGMSLAGLRELQGKITEFLADYQPRHNNESEGYCLECGYSAGAHLPYCKWGAV